jgi:radical SAM superfamily enzyme YgiQ (UPF0313 family)
MSAPQARPQVLFINPWIADFTAYDFWLKPLGLLTIASIVRLRTGAGVWFIDCLDRFHPSLPGPARSKPDGRGHFPKTEIPKPEILKDVPRRFSRYGISVEAFEAELGEVPTPDAVFLTCAMTYWYPGVQAAVDLIRKRFGRVPVVLGGIYATLCPDHARRHSGADVVVSGPGENQVLEVLDGILGRPRLEGERFATIRDWPRPAFDLLRSRDWLPVLTSRGCPYRCSFCASARLFSGIERREPSDVSAEIIGHFRRFGTANFAFYDDALLFHKSDHLVPILEAVAAAGESISLHTPNGLHVREVDDALARLFRRAGVRSIFLSQESTDPAVLRDSCPKVGEGDLERAAGCLIRAGFRPEEINVYLIAGLPDQSAASIRESILYVRRLGLKPHLAFFSPIPGTPVWDRLVAAGRIAADADPLLHNKAAFPYLGGTIPPEEWESLKLSLLEA